MAAKKTTEESQGLENQIQGIETSEATKKTTEEGTEAIKEQVSEEKATLTASTYLSEAINYATKAQDSLMQANRLRAKEKLHTNSIRAIIKTLTELKRKISAYVKD